MTDKEPEMIPRADADLAVALMVEKAAEPLMAAVWDALKAHTNDLRKQQRILQAFRALVPASALADLQALRDKLDEWKRLAIAGELTAKLQAITERRAEAAEADITTYQMIVADMTQEAEAAEAELAALRDEREQLRRMVQITDPIVAELATLRAQVERLTGAAESLGAMPEGYCFCSRNRIGDDSKTHEPECADLRAALTEGAATRPLDRRPARVLRIETHTKQERTK